MSELIKNQKFGVEIETFGISRENAIRIIAKHFDKEGTISHHNSYDKWTCTDGQERTWTCMSDCSISDPTCRSYIDRGDGYIYKGCEVVTPLLSYEDLPLLQAIIRELREAGADANESCGIHVHVEASRQTPESLRRLVKFFYSRQDLIYTAFGVGARAERWCRPFTSKFMDMLKNDTHLTKESLEDKWYREENDGCNRIDHRHYDPTRYHALNLHSYFCGKGIEYRLFNGTVNAAKIKAYVIFCLAVSAWAIESDESVRFNRKAGLSTEQAENLWSTILRRRLALTGAEYASCRQALVEGFHQAENVAA